MKRKDTVLDMVKTGQNLKRIMQLKGYTVKDIQEHLKLSTPQAIYHWFDGKSMPTIDNLYALSDLFCTSVDTMLIGNRKYKPVLYWDAIPGVKIIRAPLSMRSRTYPFSKRAG